MYAIFASGGKQYRAAPGDLVRLEKLPGDAGTPVAFDQVLLLADGERVSVGEPTVGGARVEGTIVAQGRGEKVLVVKFRRRKHHRKQMGHRQSYTDVQITAVNG